MIFDFLKRMVSKNKDKGYNSNLYDASELKKLPDLPDPTAFVLITNLNQAFEAFFFFFLLEVILFAAFAPAAALAAA